MKLQNNVVENVRIVRDEIEDKVSYIFSTLQTP